MQKSPVETNYFEYYTGVRLARNWPRFQPNGTNLWPFKLGMSNWTREASNSTNVGLKISCH